MNHFLAVQPLSGTFRKKKHDRKLKYRFALLFKVIMIALAQAVKMNVVNVRHSFRLNVENDPATRVACRVSIECRKTILLHVRAHLSTFLSRVGRGIG